jgi:hypothetical protein
MKPMHDPSRAGSSTQDRASWTYFQEASLLRTCLAYNEEDYRFAEEGGRITYLFDANIIAFFLHPERENERRKITAFRSDGRAKGYASATALITAEYLFSRRLAGQHNNPPLIGPTHGDDLADIIDRIRFDVEREADASTSENNISYIQNELDEIFERIRDNRFRSISQVAAALRRFVPKLADELEDTYVGLQQLARLYDQDLIRPLALHTSATLEILYPDEERVNRWTDLIRKERIAQRKPGSHEKSRRDAVALIQTMLLDEAAKTSADPEKRYVLVTADMALYDAYTRWYWDNQSNQGRRFVLRLPIQYIPILNTLEMPNHIHSADITKKAMLALDSLFGNLKTVEQFNYQQKLAYYRLEYPGTPEDRQATIAFFGGIDPFEFAVDAFIAARQEWSKCYANATVLNASLMHRRHSEAFDGLVRALMKHPSLREAIARDQLDGLGRIVGAHASYVTPAIARDLASIPGHRIPFLLRLEACGLPPSLTELLRGEDHQLNDQIQRDVTDIVGDAQSLRSLLLAAVVAFRNGRWVGARAFARHALSGDVNGIEGAEPVVYELRYLAAASTRHMIGLLDEIEKLVRQLDEARTDLDISARLAERCGDEFILRRARIEELALELALVRLSIHGPLPIPTELQRNAETAITVLRTCLSLLETSSLRFSGSLASALETFTRRIAVGAAAQIYLAPLENGTPRMPKDELDEAFRFLLAGRTGAWKVMPIHELHYLVGALALGELDLTGFEAKIKGIEQQLSDGWSSPLDNMETQNSLRRARAAQSG